MRGIAAPLLGALAALLALALPAAPQVLIDDFTTAQATLTAPPGGASNVVTAGADILGQHRSLAALLIAGPGPASVGVTGGALALSVSDTTPDSRGEALISWDGDSDPNTLSPTGLGSVDLTAGGTQGGFRLVIEQAAAGSTLLLTVYQDASHLSRVARVLPAIAGTAELSIAFSELAAAPGAAGPADLTDTGALTLLLGAPESAAVPTLQLSEIATQAPSIAARKIDLTTAGAPISGAVTPGTTLLYRITVANTGGAAEGVDVQDMVANDPNLALVAGSLRTSPLTRRDAYRALVDTPLDSAADLLPSLLANDLDADGDALAAVPASGQTTAQGGSVDIAADGSFLYTPPTGFTGVDAFTYTVASTAGDPTLDASGNPISSAQSTASVVLERVPPEVTAGSTLAYTEGDPATAIDTTITVSDVDSPNLAGATAAITANYAMGDDLLSFVNTANITGSFAPASGVLTLTGTDTVAAYQAALRAVRYANGSDAPSISPRTVTWTVNDGTLASAPATSTITVTAVNDPPTVTTSAGATAFTEDSGAVVVDSALTVTDPDNTSLVSAMVAITNPQDGALEVLAASACAGLTVTPGLHTLAISGTQPLATYQSCLRSVTYANSSQNPNATTRVVSFTVNDGQAASGAATKNVTVTPVNDPPVAGADSWQTVGNTQLWVDLPAPATPRVLATTASGFGVLDNDADPAEGNALAVSAISGCADATAPFGDAPVCATANGGSVLMQANGRFVYTPAAGDAAASDSFQYTVTDDGTPLPASTTATVTFNRTSRVWYVRNNAAAAGLGRSNDPFDTLVEAQTASLANDWLFVHFGDGTTNGQSAGILLKNGQRLIGEHLGLTLPVSLNGGGPSTTLFAAVPGNRPLLDDTTAGSPLGVAATDAVPAEIGGLSLAGNVNALNLTTNAAFAGSGATEVHHNLVRGSTAEGINVNHAGSGAISAAIHDNLVTAGGTGISVARTGGTFTITDLANNAISGDTAGTGIAITGVTFDAVAGLPITQVAGGTTTIGQAGNGVGASGLLLTTVTGDLGFTDLDIVNDGGSGLRVTAGGVLNAGAGTGFRIVVPAGVATVDATGGPAVEVNNASITLPLGSLRSANSPTTGLSLASAFGGAGATALSATAGAISDPVGASGTAVAISGGTGNITLGLPVTNNSGNAVTISGRSGDTVAFTGAITETGSGLSLTGNTGATLRFAGGLAATTGANPAFTATGGGSIEVCDENPCSPAATGALVNTLTATTATALNVANTTITANNLEFRAISAGTGASGPASGILLNATGSSGGLKVKGNGTAGSGGTVQRAATGISLTSTAAVSLSRMQLNDFTDFAIRGTSVVSFSMDNTVINGVNGNNAAADEGSVSFSELTGAATISNCNISGGFENNFRVVNTTGSLDRITFSGTTFGPMSVTDGNDGLALESLGSAVIKATVQSSLFTHARGDLFNFLNNGSASNDLVFTGNTLSNAQPGIATGGGGVTISGGDNGGSLTFDISGGNSFRDADGSAVLIVKSTGAGTYSGTFANNTIGVAAVANSGSVAGSGLAVQNAGGGAVTIAITGNVIRQYNNFGILLLTGGGATAQAGALNATVTGNTIGNPGTGGLPMNGIQLNGGTVPGDTYQICLDVATNGIAGSGANVGTDIRLRQRQSTTVRLRGYTGGNTDVTAVQNFLIAQNSANGAPTALASTQAPGGGFINTTGGGACPLP